MSLPPNVLGLQLDDLVQILATNVSPSALSRLRRGESRSTTFIHGGFQFRVTCNDSGTLIVYASTRTADDLATFRVRSTLLDRIWVRMGLRNVPTARRDLSRRQSLAK